MKLCKTGKCGKCGLRVRTPDGMFCYRTSKKVNPDKDFCSHFQEELIICEICGHPIVKDQVIFDSDDNETFHTICPNCVTLMGTCSICDKATTCDFKTNPVPIPFTVQKKIQRGPMTAVTEILNPERIRETCQKNCECFSEEFGCLRQTCQTCNKFVHTYPNGGAQ